MSFVLYFWGHSEVIKLRLRRSLLAGSYNKSCETAWLAKRYQRAPRAEGAAACAIPCASASYPRSSRRKTIQAFLFPRSSHHGTFDVSSSPEITAFFRIFRKGISHSSKTVPHVWILTRHLSEITFEVVLLVSNVILTFRGR